MESNSKCGSSPMIDNSSEECSGLSSDLHETKELSEKVGDGALCALYAASSAIAAFLFAFLIHLLRCEQERPAFSGKGGSCCRKGNLVVLSEKALEGKTTEEALCTEILGEKEVEVKGIGSIVEDLEGAEGSKVTFMVFFSLTADCPLLSPKHTWW